MASDYDVLIVDDDPLQAHLLEEVLRDLGHSSRVLPDGSRVLEEARRAMPRLVIVDIIMPGADGLALCMKLTPELRAWNGRVAITSGKERSIEEPRAKRAGATAFLQKPYRIKELMRDLEALLGPAVSAPPAKKTVELAVKIWGSRGPAAPGGPPSAPGATSRFGTKTPCVSVGLSSGEVYILDAGTGIRDCAAAIMSQPQLNTATLILTHYHAAHVEGLAGLPLLAKEGFQLRVGGPLDPDVPLPGLISRLGARASIVPVLLEEREYQMSAEVRLRALHAQHPTTTLAFSMQAMGKKLVYCPDAELAQEGELDVGNNAERLRQFLLGADLLIFDSHFSPEDLPSAAGQGHSSWATAVRVAGEASVRRLCLFHASLKYSDSDLARLEAAAQEATAREMTSMECVMAKDGLSIPL